LLTTHKALSYYACFNKIKFARPENFTCPARTMAIFLHNQKLSDPEVEGLLFIYIRKSNFWI